MSRSAVVAAAVVVGAVGLALAVINGSGGDAGKPAVTGGGARRPPDSNVANLWIDTNGGTCGRNSRPVAYDDARACSPATLDTAYKAARCGDVVRIKAQALPDETFDAHPKSCTPSTHVVFEPAGGETVTFRDDLDIDGPSFVTIRDIGAAIVGTGGTDGKWCNSVRPSPSLITIRTNETRTSADSHDITLDNLDGFRKFGIYGWVDDIIIRNSTFGPACDNQPQLNTETGDASTIQLPRHVTIEDDVFHDFARSDSDGHTECLQLIASRDTIVRRNAFYNCDGTGAVAGGGRDLLIENNMIQVGSGDALYACQLTRRQTGTRGLIVRNNSADGGCAIVDEEPFTHILFEGNYMPYSSANCVDQSVDNVYKGGACNASDKDTSTLVFADPAHHDLHLTAGSTDALGSVTTCPVTTDIDHDHRPAADCDAGADER